MWFTHNKLFFAFAFCLCTFVFSTSIYAQNDSLKFKIESFDSLDFYEKLIVVKKYIESDLNDNSVNLFILTYYDFTYFGDKDLFKNTFLKTSFPGDKLKEDSLYFLMKSNLYDSNVEQAEKIYQIIKESGNRNFNLAAKALSDYYLFSNPEKSPKYHEEYFTFDVLTYVNTKGASLSYWQNVDRYFLLLEMNNQRDIILKYCDSILPFKPKDESWLKRKGEAHYFLKNYEEAVRTYRQLYDINNKFEYVQDLLKIYKNTEDTTSIISLLSEHLQNDEKDIEIRHLYYQYLEYYELNILKDSLVSKVLRKDVNFYTCYVPSEKYYYYSVFQFKNNQYNEAIGSLFKAINMIDTTIENSPYRSNTFPASFHSIYQYYVYDGEWNMFTSKYFNLIAELYQKKGNTHKSIKYYKKALDNFDCNIFSNYALAYIYKYNLLRSSKKAYTYFGKVVSCDLFEWSSYYALSELANNYYKKNQLDKAKELLLKARASEMTSSDYYLLSKIYKNEKDYINSIKMLESAIELETEDWLIEWYNKLKSEMELLIQE